MFWYYGVSLTIAIYNSYEVLWYDEFEHMVDALHVGRPSCFFFF